MRDFYLKLTKPKCACYGCSYTSKHGGYMPCSNTTKSKSDISKPPRKP